MAIILGVSLAPMLFVANASVPTYSLIAALLVVAIARLRDLPVPGWTFVAAVAYLAVLLLATAVSPPGPRSVVRFVPPALLLLGFLYAFGATGHGIRSFFLVVGPIVAVSAGMNLVVFAASPVLAATWAYRLFSSFGSVLWLPSGIGIIYAVAFVGVICTVVRRAPGRWWATAILLLSAAVLLVAVVLTAVRGILIAVCAAATVLAALRSGRARLVIIAGLALGFLAFLILPALRESLLVRGLSDRIEIWGTYLAIARQAPPVGIGLDTPIDIHLMRGSVVHHPHNLFLSALIRAGALGVLSLAAFFATATFWGNRYFRQFGDPTVLCLITTVVTAGMFDYDLLFNYVDWQWLAFWLVMALACGAEIAVRQGRDATTIPADNPSTPEPAAPVGTA